MFKMKKFKVVVLHAIVYEVDVNADSKEEAENKVKDIDVNTNILIRRTILISLRHIRLMNVMTRTNLWTTRTNLTMKNVGLTDRIKTSMPLALVLASTEFVRTNSLVKGCNP